MSNGDLIAKVRKQLNLDGDDRVHVDREEGMRVLRELVRDVQHGQRAIGMVLWHMDPTPAELTKIAEELELKPATLKSWVTTYSRLRHETEMALASFSMQQQLARVQNAEERAVLWHSRPEEQWTLAALTEAVDAHLDAAGQSVMPKTKKAGCRAKFGDRQVKLNLELLEDRVIIRVATSEGEELNNMQYEKTSKGLYEVKFSW
jgi:hypothetical protein